MRFRGSRGGGRGREGDREMEIRRMACEKGNWKVTVKLQHALGKINGLIYA